MKLVFTAILIFSISFANAQYSVKAKVIDSSDKSGVSLAGVKLISTLDAKKQYAESATVDGDFTLTNIPAGKYTLQITSIGYETLKKEVFVRNKDLDLGSLSMNASSIMTDEVEVKAKQIRVEMKGDTTQFNADAYKVNPDANAEDLIRKLPGVEI
ncbi:MAG: carboxypeptidase-like regulatory domain-containing protein, partial [Spirosomaceae bacterium]|nr:carboxypeptidase-like regulatory domain-containing protein [Spirosomataceae bacterium]